MEKEYLMICHVREKRHECGLTQTQLAKKIGVSRNTISSIERAEFEPTAYTAGLLCKELGCKFDEVFELIKSDSTV